MQGSGADVIGRLLGRGFITPGEVVQDEVVLHNLSRSNQVFLARVGGVSRCLVKRALMAERADNADLARERLVFRLVEGDPALAGAPVPRWLGDIDDLMVLEVVEPGESLEDRQAGRGTSQADGHLLGEALACWRRVAPLVNLNLPGQPPWVLRALSDEPPPFLLENPPAAELIDLLRPRRDLADGLAELARRWRPRLVIHGDIRWNNVLVGGPAPADSLRENERPRHAAGTAAPAGRPVGGSGTRERAVLIDWEFAQWGEPEWDLAGAMSEAVATEALIELWEPSEAPLGREELAGLMRGVRGYLGALALGYREGLQAGVACAEFDGSAPYLAARLVHNAFQQVIWDSGGGREAAQVLARVAAAVLHHPGVVRQAMAGERDAPERQPEGAP